MKKTVYTLCSLAMVASFSLIPEMPINAEETDNTSLLIMNNEQKLHYFEVSGTISKMSKVESGYLASVESEENPFDFYINEETLVLDNSGNIAELKEGTKFTAYVDGSKPMIAIYPPRYAPDVIIVQTENPGTVQLDQFDENFLNKDKNLIIHLNEQSEIINVAGTKLTKEEIVNKEVLIFYEVKLESYPAQTGPSKVIVLNEAEQLEPVESLTDIDKAYQIAETDFYIVNGVKMVPLRLIAEQLGYQVDSTGVGAIVHKGALSFTITRGSEMYGYNKSLRTFEVAPALLEPNKTYVPYSFIEELAGHY